MIKYLISAIITVWSVDLFARKADPDFERAMLKGAQARLVLRVANDEGTPVANASVHILMGMNYRLKSYDIDGTTDTNGVFVIEGKTTGNEIEITVKKEGHYQAKKKLCFIEMGRESEVRGGNWQPWGMKIDVVMGRVKDPVPLIRYVAGVRIPVIGEWIGFDMKERDWVYPGHKGRTRDFEVNFRWDEQPFDMSKLLEMDVRFLEKYSGYYLEQPVRSSYCGIYKANANAVYTQSLSCNMMQSGSNARIGFENPYRMVVRSRCIVDEFGKLVSANYSTIVGLSIEGGWRKEGRVNFYYLFNPTANDIRLEPKR